MTCVERSARDKTCPPVRIDISYAMIMLGSSTIWAIVGGWLLYFYLPPDGEGVPLVPAALYGITTFFTRTVNALIAPPIGYLSDRSHSRWGRRLPFMFLSALPLLAFFVLLWTPPALTQSMWNLVYMALIFMLYNLAYTLNQIPYTALLPELAVTDHHRVRMSAWSSGSMLVGMIISSFAGLLIENVGYVATAILYAFIVLPLFYLPFLVLRERNDRTVPTQKRFTFRESIAAVLRNRPFQVMTAAGAMYWLTSAFIQGVIPFIVTEICKLTKADTLYFYIPAVLASLACYPLVMWLSDRMGKWSVFCGSLLASAIVLPGLMFIGEWIPIPLRAQGMIWIALQAIAMSGITMLPPAFGAEITDYDAEITGQRHEGTYYATWGLLDQVINGVASALLPLILMLGRSRSDPHGPLGVRMIGIIGGILMIVAFAIFQRYPLRNPTPSQGEFNE